MNAWSLIPIGLSVVALGLALWSRSRAAKAVALAALALEMAYDAKRGPLKPGPLDDLVSPLRTVADTDENRRLRTRGPRPWRW